MNRYWTRIAIGAVVIFAFGLTGMAAFNKGKAKVSRLLASAGVRLPQRLAHLQFRFDGRQLGELRSIDVQRSSSSELGTVRIKVALTEAASLDALRDCNLTVDSQSSWDRGEGFRCADAAELDGLAELGTVLFEPGNLTRPLFVPEGLASRWQYSGVRSLDASLIADGAGGVTARGRYNLADRLAGAERGTFSLSANQSGASISVRDDQGRSLVDFRADQNGVNLNLRDGRGRGLIKLFGELKQGAGSRQ
jgi:hypothetical protein